MKKTFGEFLKEKRMEKGASYRDLAKAIDVSAPYISDIEKGRRHAPSVDKLNAIADYFELTSEERNQMFDIAGDENGIVAPDVPSYIEDNNHIVAALRTARNLGATEKDWQDFVDELMRRKG